MNTHKKRKGTVGGMFVLLCCACVSGRVLSGEIIDRIAVSVGNQVITESQVGEEIRLTALLNREKLDVSAAERKKAAGRLIEQALIRREMELSRYPLPSLTEADASLRDIKTSYGSEAAYDLALSQYGVGEEDLKRRLLWQLTLLRFIDFRFRPGIQIPDTELAAYYQEELAKWKQQNIQQIPTYEDSRPKIEEILIERRIDQALDAWLAEKRKQTSITFLDESLK